LSGAVTVGRKIRPAPGETNVERLVCWRRSVALKPSSLRCRIAPILRQSRWSESTFPSGGGRESNPPAGFRPHTDFEGMSDTRAAFRPVTSVVVFGCRPQTCKDL
jgi:hypothetical protein